MKKNRLYNVMFPLWFLMLWPMAWLLVLPVNFGIDSAVLLLACACLKLGDKKRVWKASILKIWLFGFAADLLAGALLLLATVFPNFLGQAGDWWNEQIAGPITANPFSSVWALLFVLLMVAFAGLIIYLLNRRFSFRKLDLPARTVHRLSLTLAIVTAPYVLLVPTVWMYPSW